MALTPRGLGTVVSPSADTEASTFVRGCHAADEGPASTAMESAWSHGRPARAAPGRSMELEMESSNGTKI